MSILIIEDNPADVHLMREALRNVGVAPPLATEIAADGEAADARIRYWADHGGLRLIVLDLNLPKAAGLELLRALRAETRLASVPVVTWTSSVAPGEAESVRNLGVARHFVKPMELEGYFDIGAVIRDLLSQEDGEAGHEH